MIKALSYFSVIIILGLAACQATPSPLPTSSPAPTLTETSTLHPIPTQIPSFTPTPRPTLTITPGPSPTSSPQPALTAHEWKPQEVLIAAGTNDLNTHSPFGTTINFMLLADGQLIVRNCSQDVCTYQTDQLDRGQVCALLNTIDQNGFFDYDPSSYITPQQTNHKVFIQVSAWRSISIELDQLDTWLANPNWLNEQIRCNNCVSSPIIPPALSRTYYLLQYFRPAGMEDYQPLAMALWLTAPWVEGTPAPWILQSPSLSDLQARSRCPGSDETQAVVLRGDEASRVADYITQMLAAGYPPVFSDGQLEFQLVTQWLFPFQNPAGCPASGQASPTPEVIPVQSMQCSPADGLVPVVTPTPTR